MRTRNFITKQHRISQKKFDDLSRYAYFLAKNIRRFSSFSLTNKLNFFTENLWDLLNKSPRLRKKHPVLVKLAQEADEILLGESISDLDRKIH